MNKDYYTREQVESAIILHFGIIQPKIKCARALGITQSTVSRNLKKLTPAFIQRLKGIGVVLDNPIVKEKEVVGLSLDEQKEFIELLREKCKLYREELKSLQSQLKQIKKNCGQKEGCLIKNIKLDGN